MTHPFLLFLETSGAICSVAISYGNRLISLRESTDNYSHASEITILIDAAMQEAQASIERDGGLDKRLNIGYTSLDGVVVSDGPGSFTGLRVGLSVAKGLCYSLDIPLIALSTLNIMAHASQAVGLADSLYVPMIDARRMEVYMAIFDKEMKTQVAPTPLILDELSFNEWLSKGHSLVLSGSGVEKAKGIYLSEQFIFFEERLSSMHMILLGVDAFRRKEFMDLASHTPFYLKPPNITKAKK